MTFPARTRPRLSVATTGLAMAALLAGGVHPAAAAPQRTAVPVAGLTVDGHDVHGDILERYVAVGGAGGVLGVPLTDETGTPDGVGRFNHFTGGSIYWTPATGAHEVHGLIRATWSALGWERSPVGYPTTDERGTPDGVGRFNQFCAGSVYWSPATGAHEVHGAILATWASLGWERSALGYPASEEYAVPGGRRSDFAAGSVTWDAATGATTVAQARRPAWYGVLQPRAATLGTLRPAGVGRATLEVGWDSYEPEQGRVNAGYLAELRSRYAALRAAGLDVVLDAGLQYPPAWVFGVGGGTRFVNQYGDVWRGGIGADVPDAVFNGGVRAAQAAYLSRLGADLRDLPLAAVRVGGLYYGELHYPTAGYAGHGNSFWAYSAAAQSGSPVPGYRPGQADAATAARFLDWYLGSLSGYARWLATTYRDAFGQAPRLQVLEPSWGIRPGEVRQAADGRLTGGSRGEQRGTVNEGLDWARQLPVLAAVPGTEAYTTWLDAGDQGTDDGYESPVRYLSRVARPLGLPVSGENTGGNMQPDMARCVQRVGELGLTGMMWMREPELTDGYHASLQDYRTLIAR